MSGAVGNFGTAAERLEAVAELARVTSRGMTPLERMKGLQIVTSRLGARRPRRPALWALSLLGTMAAATGAVILVHVSKHAGSPTGDTIGYRVEGGEIGDGGYVRSYDLAGAVLRFDEGTELRLMTGARGRLTSINHLGARLAIEEGEAEVKVTPRPGARWLVDAGPFLITVRGTVFTASWDGAKEQLDVKMQKGLVSVTGPLADGMLAVRAGQHLTVNMQKKEVHLREIDGSDGSDAPSAAEAPPASWSARTSGTDRAPIPSSLPRASGTHATGGSVHALSSPISRSWAMALASGDLDSIIRDAEHRGLRRALADATSDDLAALADAARYRRRDDIARPALMAQRSRFPGSSRAHDSAFLLGRLDEAHPGGGGRALRWYDLYLKEAPSGAYSSEALGRKMTATERLSGIPAAREVAEEYLRRFPSGTYAGAARALRDAP